MKRQLLLLMLFASLGVRAQVPEAPKDVNGVIDNTPDSIAKALTARPVPGSSRIGNHPVLFLIGNSTMRTGTLGNGNNGQWGWGFYAHEYFDPSKITVENQALGGMSSRTFYKKLWQPIKKAIRPGDWVIISIGHNDNGPYDEGRARASIPGVGHDSLEVTIKETGEHETVYTYGGYMRKYINDVRAQGGHPILMSLTPRNAYDDHGKIIRKPHTQWQKQVAEEEGVPFVDLNEISGSKLDSYGPWKTDYHFFLDKIHTSRFGAMMNARSAAEGLMASHDPALDPLKAMMRNVQLPQYELSRTDGKPVVFITGDSTVKNEDKDADGMWGWGAVANTVFDETKISIVNAAMAGRSCRSYLNEGRWEKVYNSLQPGDFVLLQFGHNDISPIDMPKYRGAIATASDTCHVYQMKAAKEDLSNQNVIDQKLKSNTLVGSYEVVYSFGWYLKKFIQDVREKGATPILVSLTPRNEWPGGKMERRNDSYGVWYRQVAEETGVEFVDLHNIAADFYDRNCGSKEKAERYFKKDHTHTSLLGAKTNAECVAQGLRANNSPLARYLKTGNGQNGNCQKGDYGYLFCHMNDQGRAWTAYALSRDGFHYHDLLNGDSVFSDAEHARIEGATRDAYLFRKHDGTGYLMLCTDMNVGRFKDLKKKSEWDNYGICLLRSNDLIHWESTSFDYRQGAGIFMDPDAAHVYKDWSSINRVWAPQAVWDADYIWPDGRRGGYFVYYSMWNRAEEPYDRMYYSYADETFTRLTQPRLLFDWGYATIDADINWVEADRQWHMMIKKEGGTPGLFTSASPSLTGVWPEPSNDDYIHFEGNWKCEGVSAFQLADRDDWVIGYIEYSSRPKNYRLCLADKTMRNFREPRNIEGVSRPQHGSFLRITKEEYEQLQAWSDNYTKTK